MVLVSFGSGTICPPTKPPATSARKKGHGLLGETAICGPDTPAAVEPMRSSCMAFLKLFNCECGSSVAKRKINQREESSTLHFRMQASFGGIRMAVNRNARTSPPRNPSGCPPSGRTLRGGLIHRFDCGNAGLQKPFPIVGDIGGRLPPEIFQMLLHVQIWKSIQ